MIKKYMGLFVVFFMIFTSYANAQEKLGSQEYSPDYCQFTATFPEEPYITNYCENKNLNSCYNLISYTKTFGLSSSIRVEIICNPSTSEMYKDFTLDVMESTVRAMVKDSVSEVFDVNSVQEKNYSQSGLLGKGKKGLNETIFIAQLWSAEKSIMSVEAELIGEQTEESDKAFADILQNIGFIEELKNNEIPLEK